jgi:hypothetical protein
MAEEKKAWTPPPAGTPCWIEVPAVNVEASQVLLLPSASTSFEYFVARR